MPDLGMHEAAPLPYLLSKRSFEREIRTGLENIKCTTGGNKR
jgi:hypothetical protein